MMYRAQSAPHGYLFVSNSACERARRDWVQLAWGLTICCTISMDVFMASAQPMPTEQPRLTYRLTMQHRFSMAVPDCSNLLLFAVKLVQ